MRGVRFVAGAIYRYVAAHRTAFSRAERVMGRDSALPFRAAAFGFCYRVRASGSAGWALSM